jgi:hypothetical protein
MVCTSSRETFNQGCIRGSMKYFENKKKKRKKKHTPEYFKMWHANTLGVWKMIYLKIYK